MIENVHCRNCNLIQRNHVEMYMTIVYVQGDTEPTLAILREERTPKYKNPRLMAKAKKQFIDDYNKILKERGLPLLNIPIL